jgi:hypothetical protein
MSEGPPTLRLAKLPERTVVKMTIAITPDLSVRLSAYAKLYSETYGQEEPVAELIPYMLSKFIDDDRSFTKRARSR